MLGILFQGKCPSGLWDGRTSLGGRMALPKNKGESLWGWFDQGRNCHGYPYQGHCQQSLGTCAVPFLSGHLAWIPVPARHCQGHRDMGTSSPQLLGSSWAMEGMRDPYVFGHSEDCCALQSLQTHWAPCEPLGFGNFPSPQNPISCFSRMTPSPGPQPDPGETVGGRRRDSHGIYRCWAEEDSGSVRVILRYWLSLLSRWGTLQGPSCSSFAYL